ncbi:hypothetical protein JOC78_000167 [Bacillus ectoiniformans]|uniref:spore coat protein YlbD n=1 Tax=Bacillus ectoiniformans TaxID=1494429 RepID=UPI00195B79E5|nr:hypothetical protein [Bacillus ectoiniformans]
MSAHFKHPKIAEFKQYISERPELKMQVIKRERSLQDMFEEWYTFGDVEVEESTERVQEESSKTENDWVNGLLDALSSFDASQWSAYIKQIQSALETVQMVISTLNTK